MNSNVEEHELNIVSQEEPALLYPVQETTGKAAAGKPVKVSSEKVAVEKVIKIEKAATKQKSNIVTASMSGNALTLQNAAVLIGHSVQWKCSVVP